MFISLLASILLRLIALTWSIVLWKRLRDWRMGLLAGAMATLSARQVLTYWGFIIEGQPQRAELAAEYVAIATSALALAAVLGLGRMIQERDTGFEGVRHAHPVDLREDVARQVGA